MMECDRWLNGWLGRFFLVLVIFYLGFHALSGERGLVCLVYRKPQAGQDAASPDLADVKARREALDHKVKLLSDSSA